MRRSDNAPHEAQAVEVDKLSRKYGKYALVVAVSKRARDMKERAARIPLGPSPASYIQRALRDVASGRVKVVRSREE